MVYIDFQPILRISRERSYTRRTYKGLLFESFLSNLVKDFPIVHLEKKRVYCNLSHESYI